MGDAKNLEQRTRAIFIICPVRHVTQEESAYLRQYVDGLRREGYHVYYPPDNTHQADVIGLAICTQNKTGMKKSREVRIFYNPTSEASKFDIGMAFMAEKPFAIINGNAVVKTPDASFENFLLEFEGLYSSLARPARIDVPTDESICIICPEDATPKEGAFLEEYISPFEIGEQRVYCPSFCGPKTDSRMFEIYSERRDAIRRAKEILVYWSNTERDDKFGLGMVFMAEKPVVLINKAEVNATPEKSFNNVLIALDDYHRKHTA